MSSVQDRSEPAADASGSETIDLKLEVVVIPVSDIGRAKDFYERLGWRLDADVDRDGLRLIQITPPGSGCSIQRTDPVATSFASASDLSRAMQRAEAAHGKHEARIGHPDPDWPDWYAEYMVRERAGEELPS
jgi:catechol 2,3-dioxygenase-like lactoylglutathione lyase family enzyme